VTVSVPVSFSRRNRLHGISHLLSLNFCLVLINTQRTKRFWNYGAKYCFEVVQRILMSGFRYDSKIFVFYIETDSSICGLSACSLVAAVPQNISTVKIWKLNIKLCLWAKDNNKNKVMGRSKLLRSAFIIHLPMPLIVRSKKLHCFQIAIPFTAGLLETVENLF
jgi:hypothetical protein